MNTKQKTLLSRLLKIGSLMLAVVLLLLFLQEYVLCRNDHNRGRVKGFYLENQDTVDVVLIGASEVYAGYAAPYAYSKFGFTSYPLATQSNTILNYLACVKEAVRTQHPRLIVIEINGALYNDSNLDTEVNLRYLSDSMPDSENKRELTERFDFYQPEDDVFPLIRYHDVWKDFPSGLDWATTQLMSSFRGYYLLRGAATIAQIYHEKEKLYNQELAEYASKPITKRCRAALTELLEYCKNENLNVIFTRFPHLINKKGLLRYCRSLDAAELIRSYGFEYIGMDEMFEELGLDAYHDFYNVEHLNLYGQQKVTDYLGSMFVDRIGEGSTRLSDSERREWTESVRYYGAYYALADEIIRSGGKYRRIAEDALSMIEMQKYLD